MVAVESKYKTHEELIAAVNDPNRDELLPGTPSFRLTRLLNALDERFPMPQAQKFQSFPSPEEWYMNRLDEVLGRLDDYEMRDRYPID